MDFLLEALTNWLIEMLVGCIMSNLSGMFDSVNQQVARSRSFAGAAVRRLTPYGFLT